MSLRKDLDEGRTASNSLARHIRRFDLFPNRGIDLPYQPSTPRAVGDRSYDEVECRHGEPWTQCQACSTSRSTRR